MNKPSFMFLLLIISISLLGAFYAFEGLQASVAIVRFMGDSSFLLLCISLLIGPLVALLPTYAPLIEPRRAVGIAAFILTLIHGCLVLSLYFGLNLGMLSSTPALIAGVAAFAIMLPLALTSNDWALKSIGMGRWKLIQRLNYLIFIIAFAHFVIIESLASDYSKINAARASLLVIGAITLLMQIAGFFTMNSKKKAAAQEKPEGKDWAQASPGAASDAKSSWAAPEHKVDADSTPAPMQAQKPTSKRKQEIVAKP